MLRWLLTRLKEGSSWRGIVWLLTALGVSLDPMAWEYIMAIGMAVAGLLGVLLADAATPAPVPPAPLPPIELQGQASGADADRAGAAAAAAGQLQRDVPTVPNFGVRPPIDRGLDDQFSGGWGDR